MRISFQNPSPRKLISITSKLDFRSHYLTATWVWYIKENKNADQKKNPDFNLRWITKILWRQLFQTHLIPNDIDNHFCWQDIEPWNSKMSQKESKVSQSQNGVKMESKWSQVWVRWSWVRWYLENLRYPALGNIDNLTQLSRS